MALHMFWERFKYKLVKVLVAVFVIALILMTACAKHSKKIVKEGEDTLESQIAYFAGGCFWGMERFMEAVPGVTDVVSGYANGDETKYGSPTYDLVCSGQTGYREAVKVVFDLDLDYEMLVRAYYIAIDPTVKGRQGNDVGDQYQTGIYYLDENQKEIAEKVSAEIKTKVPKFAVEVEEFRNFYDAEEYHQNYLDKNPTGYCHISDEEILEMLTLFGGEKIPVFEKPSAEEIKNMLTPEQYKVTQNAETEKPFENEYWNSFEKGLYVDIVTGEPLFSSENKYKSTCGWPAFSDTPNKKIQYIKDYSHGMTRIEVRSGIGDSHLGHVFSGDSQSPTGMRYCINSAALRFIPYDKLVEEGYGYAKDLYF